MASRKATNTTLKASLQRARHRDDGRSCRETYLHRHGEYRRMHWTRLAFELVDESLTEFVEYGDGIFRLVQTC